MSSLDIVHQPEHQQFVTTIDGHACSIDYQLADGVMIITHTQVPAAVGGRGIAGALTRFALDTARAQGWKVRPACSYAAAWIPRHPEYTDLLAG